MASRLKKVSEAQVYSPEAEVLSSYIDFVLSLPWDRRSEDNLDLERAKEILDKNHYGIERVKERILEYIAVLKLTKEERGKRIEVRTGPLAVTKATVLCFVGLPGIGKTSLAYSIAQALDRKFIRIAMGGLGSAAQLRGKPKGETLSGPGQVLKGIARVGVKNPVLLLDEIERVSEEGFAEVMGVLLELLDPEQNPAFFDYYLDYPFDLSEALFIASANHVRRLPPPVLDRLEVIEMPAYSDEEKKIIGRDYLLPRILKATGLTKKDLEIKEALWPQIIRPLGYDAGIRTLERTLEGIARKVAKKKVLGKKKKFVISENNIKEFLPTI